MSSEPPAKVAKMTNSEVDNANTIPTDKSIAELKKEVQKTANGTNSLNYEYNSISDDENTELKFKKLSENATTPLRASRNAAGFDLFSAEDKTIPAQGHGLVKTDIAIMLPKGTYGRIAPRSSLAYKKFIDLGAGVVDYDYRGNVGVVIFNHFKEPFVVKKGDRIAQLVVEKIAMPALIEVQEINALRMILHVNERIQHGSGGFVSMKYSLKLCDKDTKSTGEFCFQNYVPKVFQAALENFRKPSAVRVATDPRVDEKQIAIYYDQDNRDKIIYSQHGYVKI